MPDTLDSKLRPLVYAIVDAGPPPPPFADIEVLAGSQRSSEDRPLHARHRSVIAAVTAFALTVTAVALWLIIRSDHSGTSVQSGPASTLITGPPRALTGWTKEARFEGQVFAVATAHGVEVAVGYGIWSSDDNQTWTRATVPGFGTGLDGSVVTDVVAANGRFVAVGTGADKQAAVWDSTDGSSWVRQHSKALQPTTPSIPAGVTTAKSSIAAVAATDQGFVAVGQVFQGSFVDGTLLPGGFAPAVWTSPDGHHWQHVAGPHQLDVRAPFEGGLRAVTSRGDTVVVAGPRTIWQTSDLTQWRATTLPTASITQLATQRGAILAAGTDGVGGTHLAIWRSQDLSHWKKSYEGAPAPISGITALVASPTSVLALGYAGSQEVTTPGLLLQSTDGRAWKIADPPLPTPGQPYAGTVDGNTFLVVTSDPRTNDPNDYSRAVGVYRSK